MPIGDVIAWPALAWLHARLFHQIKHVVEPKPAQMGAVEQALILKPEAFDEWLNPAIHEFSDLNRILKAGRELKVQSHPVSKYGDTHGL